MIKLLIYFFMAISLSMDAFSLSLSLGVQSPSLKEIKKTSLIIGLFHFIMPIIGSVLGLFIKHLYRINNINLFSSLIFLFLAIEMYLDRNKEESIIKWNLLTILTIALTVSIDSLSVGFIYSINQESIVLASTFFMIISMMFTYIGLRLGKRIKEKYQDKACNIGIIIMLSMAFKYLFFS